MVTLGPLRTLDGTGRVHFNAASAIFRREQRHSSGDITHARQRVCFRRHLRRRSTRRSDLGPCAASCDSDRRGNHHRRPARQRPLPARARVQDYSRASGSPGGGNRPPTCLSSRGSNRMRHRSASHLYPAFRWQSAGRHVQRALANPSNRPGGGAGAQLRAASDGGRARSLRQSRRSR